MAEKIYNRLLIWTIRVFLCVALILILGSYHPKYLFVDWGNTKTLPVEVTDRIEIGSDRSLLKRESLSLICSQNRVRILLRRDLQLPTWIILKENIPSVLRIDSKQEISLSATRFDEELIDSVLTEPLNSNQIRVIVQKFDNKEKIHELDFSISEINTYLNVIAKPENIRGFAKNCTHQKNI